MMSYLRLLISAVLLCGLVWGMHQRIPVGKQQLPAPGHFFNPFSGFWRNAEPAVSVFPASADWRLSGLTEPVEVVFDDLMVPHIFAGNELDAVRVQGYLLARDRLWQMDISTRKAAGRLSEVLGERTLEIDRMTRRHGLGWAAERDLASWQQDDRARAVIDAFTDGVNAYIAALRPADYPIEFKILGYAPEPWTPLKSALMAESMAETLVRREFDLPSTQTRDLLGQEVYDALFPDWNPEQQPIVPDHGQWTAVATTPAPATDTAASMQAPTSHRHKPRWYGAPDEYQDGSNNWALSGARTRSGKPMLANDPHLTLNLPSIWYQVQIHTPTFNCYGVSLPGVPGVIIGFNEHLAWGITNASHDVADWYRIQWSNDQHTAYRYDDTERPATYRVETIGVKGRPPVQDTVTYTVWGPVVHERDPEHPLRDCAFRWLVHDPSEPLYPLVFLNLAQSKGWDDYRQAIAPFDVPAQNMVMATRTGAIGITVQGHFPLRRPGQGKFVQDGSRSDNAWQGRIPQAMNPAQKDPEQAFVFSANQHSTPPSYPYYYHGDFEDFRGRRIHERLSTLQGATLDTLAAMQQDNFSRRAADALPAMLHLLGSRADADDRQIRDVLQSWNFQYEAGQRAPIFFEYWFDACYRATWDELRTDSVGFEPRLPDSWRFIDLLRHDTLNVFFDNRETPLKESAGDIVRAAYDSTLAHFAANPDLLLYTWGQYRPVEIKHMGRIEGFGRTLTNVGGHGSAPNAQKDTHGPSWRMLVALEDSVYARGVYPGGQSGNPGSPYYDNMVDAWAEGRYFDLLFLASPSAPTTRVLGRVRFTPEP